MRNLSLVIFFIGAMLSACATGPADIPGDISPEELIQRAQEASDRNRYKLSLQYYEVIPERFPSNIDFICAAEYEIAFIHYKQKKYAQAREELQALLRRYEGPDAELLPGQFRVLAEIVLKRIGEKQKPKEPAEGS
jgi:outer membrane protein assembly factor BamD (BamD/ComL family)